ncbi:MAG TPA: sulfotransferase [Solirubrobacterales bacterium]|nr:sulfotransferase [Solirubrobacterales bacterium]
MSNGHRHAWAGLEGNEDRLAWIFGSSRSGSTWLLRMLSELSGVVPIDDPHLGHHLGVWRPIPLAWAISEQAPELTTLTDLKESEPGYFFAERHRDSWWQPLRALIFARFEAQQASVRRDNGAAPTYVVKEPGSQVAPLLMELFPASKLIFLLRDGRDVVDSWLAAYSEGSWAIPGGAFPVAPAGRLALIRWLSAVWVHRSRAVKHAYESHPDDARLLIRYEALREQTDRCLGEACELLGLDPGDLEQAVERHRFEQVPAAARGPREEVRIARPGSWRENLSSEEQAAMHEVLGGTLEELGYGEARPRRRLAVA